MQSTQKIFERIASARKIEKRRKRSRLTANDKKRCKEIAEALEGYYSEHGRIFPWRESQDAYAMAVAEILLQKTRAESVVSAYVELIRCFPDAAALSVADVDELERRIHHLGLSRKRSVHLKNLAATLVERGIDILRDQDEGLTLPGLWRYGSCAVVCFAFGKPVGIVDANVRRVFCRVFSLRDARGERRTRAVFRWRMG